MSVEEDYRPYFFMLDLDADATLSDVRNKYHSLKSLYSADSMELAALNFDLPDDRIPLMLEQLEEAHAKLTDFFEGRARSLDQKEILPSIRTDEIRKYAEGIDKYNGSVLRDIRARFDVELHDIANITRIGKQHLENIEAERFSAFDAEVYLRGYVVAYARCLSLDPVKVVTDYMEIYRVRKTSGSGLI